MSNGMKSPPRKTTPDVRRRALELLAAHPNGCTEAILAAENIPAEVLINLVRSGLAVARSELFEDDDGAVEVTRVWIAESGKLELVRSPERKAPPKRG
jgi:hypothetical protein